MELKTFKKIINDLLISKGFSKKGNYFVLSSKDIIFSIGLQKSNYSNSYYINIGYIISQLNPSLENYRDVDGDIRARFSFDNGEKRIDYFDLEGLAEDELTKDLEDNLKQYIEPVTSIDRLKVLLKERPVMLYQTKLVAKQFLGFD